MRKKLFRFFKKSKRSSDQADRARYIKTKASAQREERQNYWRNNLIVPPEEDESVSQGRNQKRFWRYIKSLRRDNTGFATLKDQGRLHPFPRDKANILNHQYQSVFTQVI